MSSLNYRGIGYLSLAIAVVVLVLFVLTTGFTLSRRVEAHDRDITELVPQGTIIAWSPPSKERPLAEQVPIGWVPCDGSNPRAPDLRDRFLMGSTIGSAATLGGARTYGIGPANLKSSKEPLIQLEDPDKSDDKIALGASHAHELRSVDRELTPGEIVPPFYSVVYLMRLDSKAAPETPLKSTSEENITKTEKSSTPSGGSPAAGK